MAVEAELDMEIELVENITALEEPVGDIQTLLRI